MLGAVKRLVAVCWQQLRRLAVAWFDNRQANAQGQALQRVGRVGEVQRFESSLYPLGDMHAALQSGIGEDDGEFLAALAAGADGLALQARVQDLGNLA